MRKRTHLKDIVFLAVILILVLVMLYSGLRILESTVLRNNQIPTEPVRSKTITWDGVDYFPRQDITTVLIMGIDRYGVVEDSHSYTNPGAADMNMLLVFDETNQSCTALHINRDTMLEMPVLGIGGKEAGTYFGHLALAHTYGTGLNDSAENTRYAVSDFLYGIRIDYYAAFHMDAIAIMNDAVDGVTVEVTEDFSAVDPTITLGSVKLMGEQAVNFVRTRKDVGDQLNLSRMERQMEYLEGFADAFKTKREAEPEFLLDAYEALEPYMVTDCSADTIASLFTRYAGFEIQEVLTPEGENRVGEKYMEFHVDEEKLDDLVLSLLYAPKE